MSAMTKQTTFKVEVLHLKVRVASIREALIRTLRNNHTLTMWGGEEHYNGAGNFTLQDYTWGIESEA